MNSTVLVALLLASVNWSFSYSTVTVKPGEDAVLSCRNVHSGKDMMWASLVHNGNYSCIATTKASLCPGLTTNTRFDTDSNSSFVTLIIKRVEMADSGFYFCVFDVFGNGDVDVVQLNVEGNLTTLWMSIALGSLCILLIMTIIGFALKVKKLQTAQSLKRDEPRESLATDNLNYASVNFQPKTSRTNRACHDDPRVIYSATR
ncbi:hypothetical protein WMY93_014827 [Mugilogobius chulae]|uniref:Immunoglobulin domain-containing protein n=1 Tax=Mugilogobius chulae TaxID=88201 RepID=A0AAW0P6D3_9GOBI